ncbi:MAG TPA: metal-sulfur cluster assembly factor [Acidobacteriota bacterium]
MITEEQVRSALVPVSDPEIGLSIVELGLVRGIEVADEGKKVNIKLTLTSQMCPLGPEIMAAAHGAVQKLDGVEDVQLDLVWDPPWDPRRDASDDAKAYLGIWE